MRRHTAGSSPYIAALIGALILCSFAVYNGYAIFFNDSRSYVRGGSAVATKIFGFRIDDKAWKSRAAISSVAAVSPRAPGKPDDAPKAVTGNRSVYYGLLAFFGYRLSNFWLTILVQSLAVSSVAAIALLRGLNLGTWTYVTTIFFIALLTDAGVFVAYIMPDIFAAVVILVGAVTFAFWDRLVKSDRLCLFGIGAYAVCTHPSHLVILGMIIVLVAIVYTGRRTLFTRGGAILLLVGCEFVGIVATLAFNVVATRLTGERPLLLPHITAHLVEMGPGMDYIRARCPRSGFAVCKFASHLPVGWVDFLSSTDPQKGVFEIADPATQRQLSDEQTQFAEAVVRFDPIGVIVGTARDVARQTLLFDLDTLKLSAKARHNFHDAFPVSVYDRIVASQVGQGDSTLDTISRINLSIVFLSAGGLLFLAFRRQIGPQDPVRTDADTFAAFLVAGVLFNAVVCGALASPEPRFQSRVVWLIPLAFAAMAISRQITPRGADGLRRRQRFHVPARISDASRLST